MTAQQAGELAQALPVGRDAGLRRKFRLLAQRLAERDDEAQIVAQEARDGGVELRHALADILFLEPVDRAPAEPQQARRQRHDDQRHQGQDGDAERNRLPPHALPCLARQYSATVAARQFLGTP